MKIGSQEQLVFATTPSSAPTTNYQVANKKYVDDNKFTNPMTTIGDIIYGGTSGAATRLAGNTTTTAKVLTQTGNGTNSAAPTYQTIATVLGYTPVSSSSPTITSPTFATSTTYSYATATTVPYLNASKQLVSSVVTPTELGYVSGVTSAIQTQIGNKANSASPTFTGTVILPSTTSIGDVSSTELGYLDGVTSAIQTQITAKQNKASTRYSKGNISGAVTIDFANGDYQVCTTTAAVTGITISNLPTEQGMLLEIYNSGGYSVTYNGIEIIAATDTGRYACAFYNNNSTIYFMGKGRMY